MPRRSASPPRSRAPHDASRGKDLASRVGAISARLKGLGLKRSAVRDVVVEEFLREGTHVSIEQLLERVRARVPATGYSTVYRTLRLLVEHGHAVARDFGGTRTLFEPADKRHHDHIVCVRCGAVREFEDKEFEALQEKVAHRLGYRFTSHRLELFGLCPSCALPAPGGPRR